MGVGGVLLPPRGYFPKIQAVLAKHDVLLIDDEVITGFGRTGELWGAQAFGMRPQTLTAAKALSSAYLPISAVIVPEFLYEPMIEASGEVGLFGHGFTYSGHPVAAAVALRALGIYEERKLYEHVRKIAPQFQAALSSLAAHPLVGDTRGIGLVGACELVRDKATKAAFDAKLAVGAKCMQLCQEHGLDRARDRRRHRAVPAVHRDAGRRRRDLHEAAPRARRHARVGEAREAAVVSRTAMNASRAVLARRDRRQRARLGAARRPRRSAAGQRFGVALSPLWSVRGLSGRARSGCSSSASASALTNVLFVVLAGARSCAAARRKVVLWAAAAATLLEPALGRSRWSPSAATRERLFHLGLLVRAARAGGVSRSFGRRAVRSNRGAASGTATAAPARPRVDAPVISW